MEYRFWIPGPLEIIVGSRKVGPQFSIFLPGFAKLHISILTPLLSFAKISVVNISLKIPISLSAKNALMTSVISVIRL
jgi:hypothetical protein